jgi:hypothetical protein
MVCNSLPWGVLGGYLFILFKGHTTRRNIKVLHLKKVIMKYPRDCLIKHDQGHTKTFNVTYPLFIALDDAKIEPLCFGVKS